MVDEHMDSESGLVIAHSHREKKQSYWGFLLDMDDMDDSSDQELSTTVTHKVHVWL